MHFTYMYIGDIQVLNSCMETWIGICSFHLIPTLKDCPVCMVMVDHRRCQECSQIARTSENSSTSITGLSRKLGRILWITLMQSMPLIQEALEYCLVQTLLEIRIPFWLHGLYILSVVCASTMLNGQSILKLWLDVLVPCMQSFLLMLEFYPISF